MDSDRLFCAKWIVVVGLGWGLMAARKVWQSPRQCPKTPLLENLPELPHEFVVYRLLFLLLAAIAALDNPVMPVFVFVTLVGILCVYDWARFRPWIYQNSFLLMAMAICYGGGATSAGQMEALNVCRLIIVSIYFWAGVLKLNAAFFKIVFPWFLGPWLSRLPPKTRGLLLGLGMAVPFIEAGLALGLLFPESRMAALAAAVAMHGLILVCFSPLGHKTYRTIWPWNLSMLLTAMVVFGKTHEIGPWDILVGQSSLFHGVVLLLFAALPGLGLCNLLDPVFSHGHMSGRHVFGHITMSRRLFKNLPAEIQRHCLRSGRFYVLDVSQWYLQEVKVPPAQQERMLCRIARDFQRYGSVGNELSLTVFRMPSFLSATYPQKVYGWSELSRQSSRSALMPI